VNIKVLSNFLLIAKIFNIPITVGNLRKYKESMINREDN
jgi:hypothetical protein